MEFSPITGIWLNDEQRLFPVPDGPRQHQQEEPIGPSARWALDLTVEDDQLLTEQRVLSDEVFPGAGQILQGSHEEGATRWPRPLQYTLLDPPERALESALERSEHSSHSSIGSFKKRGEVRDTGERALMHGFYFDDQRNGKQMSRRISITGPKC
jgi:hypothetical protein